jgi:hypothetical protein
MKSPSKIFLFTFAILSAFLSISAHRAQAQVGVDGMLGPEWSATLPFHIAGAPSGQPGVGVAYDVYSRADAQYFYVLVNALPAGEGNDNWTSTIAAQLGNVVNLGLDLNPAAGNGSDIVLETENNRYATFDNVGNVLYEPYSATNGIVQVSTAVRGYDNANPGFSVELAIPWTFFETDPDGTGNMPVLTAANPLLNFRYSQSFDGTFALQGPQYGPTRFGNYLDPNVVPEPSTSALIVATLMAGSFVGFAVRRKRGGSC